MFTKVEKELLTDILQNALNSDDYKNYGPVIKNI